MNAIEISGLCKSYEGFRLENFSLNLPKGSILGLAGENGAGKSTIIKLIMNAERRDAGSVRVLGTECTAPEFSDLKNDIGIVLDEANFPTVLTPKMICRVMESTYKNWNSAQYFDYVRRFALPEDKKFKDFSRGMKMKLAIAAALSHNAKLLVLDEATGGLDPLVRDEILDILNDFTRDEEHSILMSSHIVSDIEKICDYFAFIHQGRLLLFGEKDEILSEYAVTKVSEEELCDIAPQALHGVKHTPYGVEALVEKRLAPETLRFEHTSLEDIIIFLAREGER